MARALKVYRTSTGFHDAYVAAPSRAATLRAWGAERDLFALGAAEEVSDAKLSKAPLATPGEVIKVARTDDGGEGAPAPKTKAAKAAKARQPVLKRPSRKALDKAEAALEAVEGKFAAQRAALDRREAELAAERRRLIAAERKARDTADAAMARARTEYEEKLDAWRQASG